MSEADDLDEFQDAKSTISVDDHQELSFEGENRDADNLVEHLITPGPELVEHQFVSISLIDEPNNDSISLPNDSFNIELQRARSTSINSCISQEDEEAIEDLILTSRSMNTIPSAGASCPPNTQEGTSIDSVDNDSQESPMFKNEIEESETVHRLDELTLIDLEMERAKLHRQVQDQSQKLIDEYDTLEIVSAQNSEFRRHVARMLEKVNHANLHQTKMFHR